MRQPNLADRGKASKDAWFGCCLPVRASQKLSQLRWFVLSVFLAVSLASATPRWVRWYGGTSGDAEGYDVQQTRDGGYVVVGETHVGPNLFQTLWILRLDSLGDTLWTREYRPSGWAACGTAVAIVPDQGFLVATYACGIDSATPMTIYVLRTDSLGDTLWSRFYRFDPCDEEVTRVIATADGNYVLGGYSRGHNSGYALLFKIDDLGDTLWTRKYIDSATGSAIGTDAAETPDHGFMLTGVAGYPYKGYLARTDSEGNLLWARTYGDTGDNELCSVGNAPCGFIASGCTDSHGAGGFDAWVLWLDDSGDTIRTRTYGGPEDDYGGGQPTFDDGYIVVGQSFSFGPGDCSVWLVKTDSVGDTEWTRTFGGPDWNGPNNVRQARDSGYIVVGSTNSFSACNAVYLIKTDGQGMAGIETRPAGALQSASLHPVVQVASPTSPGSRIRYFLPRSGTARLDLFDVTGRRTATFAQGIQSAGWHEATLSTDLSTGTFFLRLVSGGQAVTRRVVVVSSSGRS